MSGYLVIQEVKYLGTLTEGRLEKLMDALIGVEDSDPTIADPDLAARMGSSEVDIQMTVEAEDPADAATKALCALRTAIHVIGGATPGWETASAIMRIAPSEESDRLFTDA